jgi:guanylate kinase
VPGASGSVVVISGPSGVGKGSVAKALRERRPDLRWSVSVTTRRPRPGEAWGDDYHFVSPEAFQELILEDAFLEWADVYGNRYGTLARPVEEARARGETVLLELDVQGALAVKARIPDSVLIFLIPPSDAHLEARLRSRRTEHEEAIQRRLAAARSEMGQRDRFDHVVLNDELHRAVDEVAAILDVLQSGASSRQEPPT